jgi:branched-chain amino acid transport system permease protein
MEKSKTFSASVLWVLRGVALLVMAAIPIIHPDDYSTRILSLALIFSIAALGMQLLIGFAGQLSIGQAAFLGIGAYSSAILTSKLGIAFPIAFLLSGVLAAMSSLALVPIVRLRGVYLAVATLGFTIIVHLVLQNEDWLTGGTFGFMKIPAPKIGTITFGSDRSVYYLCLVSLSIVYVALTLLVSSRFGRALQAIMLDEDAARASGINPAIYKSKCFVVAAFVTGLAGSLFAHHEMYLTPNDFTFWRSIEILIMAAVGGLGSLPGAILGAFTITLLPEYLRVIGDYRMLIYGTALVILMGIGEGGLARLAHDAVLKIFTYSRRSKPSLPAEAERNL